jgi:pimeloyl-ACP methyl ester carboxylesterase
MKGWLLWLSLLWAALPAAALARFVERQIDLPVAVKNAYGKEVAQAIKVTLFVDDTTPARWFASQGFAVAVPTRIGYGVSGGEDVEDSGDCSRKNYPPGYHAAAQQTLAVLAAMHERPDTVKDRDIVVGQSYGGTTAITIAALNPSGVVAAINFAGGGGEFVRFPPHGDNGHGLFTLSPPTWKPVVGEFLRKQGYRLKDSP